MSGRKSPPPLYFSLTSQPGGELQPKDLSGNLAEDRVLHSLRDSAVVWQSLRQSRERWLAHAFPVFSRKAVRGSKLPTITPIVKTEISFAQANLTIGPHLFMNATLYEVQYPTSPVQALPPEAAQKLSETAKSDAVLSNLLERFASGRETQGERDTFMKFLQDWCKQMGIHYDGLVPPPKEFDIVFDLQERPNEKYLLSRSVAVLDVQPPSQNGLCEMTLRVPAPSEKDGTAARPSPAIIPLQWSRISPAAKDIFLRWMGGPEKMKENRKQLAKMVTTGPKRKFLKHQLPDCETLECIKAAMNPAWSTKSVKPPNADRGRPRRPAARKPAIEPSIEPSKTSEQPTKRKRALKANQPPPPLPIACHSCGQTDVPLLMGGRFCRTCVDAGKGVEVAPLPIPPGAKKNTQAQPAAPTLQVRMYAPPMTGSSAPAASLPSGSGRPAIHTQYTSTDGQSG